MSRALYHIRLTCSWNFERLDMISLARWFFRRTAPGVGYRRKNTQSIYRHILDVMVKNQDNWRWRYSWLTDTNIIEIVHVYTTNNYIDFFPFHFFGTYSITEGLYNLQQYRILNTMTDGAWILSLSKKYFSVRLQINQTYVRPHLNNTWFHFLCISFNVGCSVLTSDDNFSLWINDKWKLIHTYVCSLDCTD